MCHRRSRSAASSSGDARATSRMAIAAAYARAWPRVTSREDPAALHRRRTPTAYAKAAKITAAGAKPSGMAGREEEDVAAFEHDEQQVDAVHEQTEQAEEASSTTGGAGVFGIIGRRHEQPRQPRGDQGDQDGYRVA